MKVGKKYYDVTTRVPYPPQFGNTWSMDIASSCKVEKRWNDNSLPVFWIADALHLTPINSARILARPLHLDKDVIAITSHKWGKGRDDTKSEKNPEVIKVTLLCTENNTIWLKSPENQQEEVNWRKIRVKSQLTEKWRFWVAQDFEKWYEIKEN